MSEQEPSVGRIVHYYERLGVLKIGPLPAIITGVDLPNTGAADLHVFARPGNQDEKVSAVSNPNLNPEKTRAIWTRYWVWPPRV